MHTNLYILLDEARAWALAQGTLLSIFISAEGNLVIQGYESGAPVSTLLGAVSASGKQWTVSSLEVHKGLGIDPVGTFGVRPEAKDQLGSLMKTYLGGPLGLLRLAATLQDANADLTKAVKAQAEMCLAKMAAGEPLDAEPEPIAPEAAEPAINVAPFDGSKPRTDLNLFNSPR